MLEETLDGMLGEPLDRTKMSYMGRRYLTAVIDRDGVAWDLCWDQSGPLAFRDPSDTAGPLVRYMLDDCDVIHEAYRLGWLRGWRTNGDVPVPGFVAALWATMNLPGLP